MCESRIFAVKIEPMMLLSISTLTHKGAAYCASHHRGHALLDAMRSHAHLAYLAKFRNIVGSTHCSIMTKLPPAFCFLQ